jgi:hypothetical protein
MIKPRPLSSSNVASSIESSTLNDQSFGVDAPGFAIGEYMDIEVPNGQKQKRVEELGSRHWVTTWDDYLQSLVARRVAARKVHEKQRVVRLVLQGEGSSSKGAMSVSAGQRFLAMPSRSNQTASDHLNPTWMPAQDLIGQEYLIRSKFPTDAYRRVLSGTWVRAEATPVIATDRADVGWIHTPTVGTSLGILKDFSTGQAISNGVPLPAGCDPSVQLRTTVHELVVEDSEHFFNYWIMCGANSTPKKPTKHKTIFKYPFELPQPRSLRLEDATNWFITTLPQCRPLLEVCKNDSDRLIGAHTMREEMLTIAVQAIHQLGAGYDFRLSTSPEPLATLQKRIGDGEISYTDAELVLLNT